MNLDLPVKDIITQRCSWRSFAGTPLSQEARKKLVDFLEQLNSPPFGSQTRFGLVDGGVDGAKRVPGTYGVIRGARDFIVGTVEAGEQSLEDYGYLFEKAILFATAMDLGTCWMGGTLKHTVFAEKIGLQANESLPCICPVGVRASRRNILDAVFVAGAGSKKRKAWDELFFDGDFSRPLAQGAAGDYALPLEMVRLAPSASNRQPWRILRLDDAFHFFLTRNRAYKNMFKADLQSIDMGIAMCHFELTSKEAGLDGKWVIQEPGTDQLPGLTSYVVTWQKDG